MSNVPELKTIFERLHQTADFEDVDFSDLNAAALDGDNALHCVLRWGDLAAAKALIDAGIEVNKYGDLGYTRST
jgi:ankyrin repeat protein